MIKEYFANYFLHTSDVTFDIQNNQMSVHQRKAEPWERSCASAASNSSSSHRVGQATG